MAKDLRTSVKLDTKSAVRSLDQLEKRIRKINDVVNKTNSRNSGLTKAITNASKSADTLSKKVNKVTSANNQAATSANKIAKGYQKSNSAVSALTKNIRTLISTYVGLMGAKAVINASDTITSAENKLGYANGNNAKLTQQTMDKTYAAAQRSRGIYSEMLDNVAKTMVLAGDSFDNNVDNAVRFQEIMSKAYTVGGASAAEQASSMYQLVQALGSGILQGDELRSVREGAPIAYKEIEKFAQGVYKTEESLKELASQGKITSDIVVAAVMNAGDSIDTAFENTTMTFAQAFNRIKNMALQAFTPVLQMLNDALNSTAGKAIVDGIGKALVYLANMIIWVGNLLGQFFSWCADNWYWLQWVVYAVIAAIVVYLGIMAAQAVIAGIRAFWAFITGMSPLYLWIIMIGVVIGAIVYLANTVASGCDFIVSALLVVAFAIALIAIITNSTVLAIAALIIAVIAILLTVFMEYAEQIVGGVLWMGAVIANIGLGIANFFIACWNWICAAWQNAVSGIVNIGLGLWNAMGAIGQNIGIAFENAWIWAKNAFWEFIADVLTGVSKLEPVINGIAKLIGKEGIDFSGAISSVRSKKGEYKSFVDVSTAWNTGMSTNSYQDLGDAWSKGINTYDYLNLSDAYSTGAKLGANWRDKLENFGSSVKDKVAGFSIDDLTGKFKGVDGVFKANGLDGVTNGLNNLGNLGKLADGTLPKGSYLPDPYDPAYGLNTSDYDPEKVLDNIAADTGSISDAMDLTEEDLEYLRKIAGMEWKKEFTTAKITVDMSNYNTISGDSDLDGIVTRLSDKLYEELSAVADGVYA